MSEKDELKKIIQLPPPAHFIQGEWVAGEGPESLPVLNPATGQCLQTINCASMAQVGAAVQSAQAGFKQWSCMPPEERGAILYKAAQLLRTHNDALALLETDNTGKPIQESLSVDILSGAQCLEFYAGICAQLGGEAHHSDSALIYTRREPYGVVGAIGAWNYPMQIACWKAAPALACGNAMVFKPSELTPLTAQCLAAVFQAAGLPNGVFNVLIGGAETGKALAAHAGVAKLSLTGSVKTGHALLKQASERLVPVSLELGGKSPLIVFASADLEQAVSAALMANFYTQGEICSNGTRVFVHDRIYDAFLDQFVARAKRLKVGNPRYPETQIGALISQQHLSRVCGYIQQGVSEGATLACGGERVFPTGCQDGNFVQPTIFTDCSDQMQIVREEIFGPVACLLRFSDEAQVISRANASDYGLAAGVFTQDLAQGHRVVAQLAAGTCWINDYNITPIVMPFGGVKASGMGRENGLAAIESYTQTKSVYVALRPVACPYD